MSTRPTKLDRLLAAYPLACVYLILLVLYAWQTTKIVSPWIFTDELKWALLSRGIAHTGEPMLRAHPSPLGSLYAYYLAPAWWAQTTGGGYAAAKYLNAVVMTATLFPAYGLGRLFLTRPYALLAAAAAAAIPSLALTGVLMPETLAYFWSTIVLYTGARALMRPTRRSIAVVVVTLGIAPFVREQLRMLVLAALLAAAIMFATSPRARAVTATWTRGDWFRVWVLLLGGAIAFDVFLVHHSGVWFVGTHYWHRAFTYGLWALGALTIGVGIVPVVLGLAWLLRRKLDSIEERALFAVATSTIVWYGLYTAIKASYLSTIFATRVEERNVIYLSPVVFVLAARYLADRRVRLLPLALSTAATGWLLWSTPYHAYEHLYSDAFGLSIMQWLNQTWMWTIDDLRWLLFSVLAGSALYALSLRTRRIPPGVTAVVAAVVALAVIGWNLTGEISAASQAGAPARAQRAQIPNPPDWIDRETGHRPALFVGKALQNSESFWTIEFWNQSIGETWSVDGSTPPPGPTVTPNYTAPDGTLQQQLAVDWLVAPPDIGVHGKPVEKAGGLILTRVPHPIKLTSLVAGITPDGWMQDGQPSHFVRFALRPLHGVLTISASRLTASACGDLQGSVFTFRVGHLRIDKNFQPALGRIERIVRTVVRSNPCETKTLTIPAVAPLYVDGSSTGYFTAGDGRKLTAQVGYSFAPG